MFYGIKVKQGLLVKLHGDQGFFFGRGPGEVKFCFPITVVQRLLNHFYFIQKKSNLNDPPTR